MKERKNSFSSVLRSFIIPLICFLLIPWGLAIPVNSFLIYPYLRNTLKMEFSYYKECVYYLVANNREMNENVRGDLNRFCISGVFPFVDGFNDFNDENRKKDLDDIKKKIENHVLSGEQGENIENIKKELSKYVYNKKKEDPERVIEEFDKFIQIVLLSSFYFLELCLFILLQWKFKTNIPTITYDEKDKGKK
jgi:hypothetical protein